MIISKTPLRISFAGGGTDFAGHFKEHGGAVVSTAIDKYIYVIVKRRIDDDIYLHWSEAREVVKKAEDLKHDLVREAMIATDLKNGIEVVTLSDVPTKGCGLGSSSSLMVGLLNAFWTLQGKGPQPDQLAQEASFIEAQLLEKSIGYQDQVIAAYGGFRHIIFEPYETMDQQKIVVHSVRHPPSSTNFLLFSTGQTRQAETILREQNNRTFSNTKGLNRLKWLATDLAKRLNIEDEEVPWGEILDEGWQLKKKLAPRISDERLDKIYRTAKESGAQGGKLLGAGGGGYFLFYCPLVDQPGLRYAMTGLGLAELEFNFVTARSEAHRFS